METLKGEYKGECNRTACNNSNAIFYNHSTLKHYCGKCAYEINVWAQDFKAENGHELCVKVEPKKLETLYRKVTFEIEAQDHNGTILIGKNANFIFNPNTKNGEELSDFLSGCEEISDSTAKLQADKEELLEALEETNRRISIIKSEPDGIVRETMIDMLPIGIETLIQKHKQ